MRELKNRYILIVAFSTVLTFFGGCSEDKLNVDPVNQVLSVNFFETENQIFNALVGVYDPVAWSYAPGEGAWISYVMFGEIRSDNAQAGGDASNNDQPGWQNFDDYTNLNSNGVGGGIYRRNYVGIGRATTLLENAKISTPLVQRYLAEARFLRAYFHFEAFRYFGPIPVVTKELTPADKDLSRNTMSEVFQTIVADLEAAIPLLPSTLTASEIGRASKGAAYALLGKVYLYWADLSGDDKDRFKLAAENLQKVVDLGVYQLEDDFKSLYAHGVKNPSESIFEAQHTNEFPSDWSFPDGIDGNAIVQLCGIRGLCSSHPEYKEGWGFMLPTKSLYDHYLADDTYRRDITIISEAELSTICGAGGVDAIKAASNPVDYTGYWQEKFANYLAYDGNNVNGGTPELTKDANSYIIRYADVLLMLAEALHRGDGNDAQAQTYIDQVRERAAGAGDNSGSFKTAQDLINESNGLNNLLDVIYYERRAELAIEGDRWFDLVRTGRAEGSLFGSGDLRAGNFDANQHLWLPIPLQETSLAPNLTTYPSADLFN